MLKMLAKVGKPQNPSNNNQKQQTWRGADILKALNMQQRNN